VAVVMFHNCHNCFWDNYGEREKRKGRKEGRGLEFNYRKWEGETKLSNLGCYCNGCIANFHSY